MLGARPQALPRAGQLGAHPERLSGHGLPCVTAAALPGAPCAGSGVSGAEHPLAGLQRHCQGSPGPSLPCRCHSRCSWLSAASLALWEGLSRTRLGATSRYSSCECQSTPLLSAVLDFWGEFLLRVPVLPDLFLLVRTSSSWCTFMFIASFLHGLMIRKDNSGPGLKLCCSAWTNNCILMAPDKGLALGFGKELLLLLEIVWPVHFIWASAIKNYLYPPKGTNPNDLHCWDKSSGSVVIGQEVMGSV